MSARRPSLRPLPDSASTSVQVLLGATSAGSRRVTLSGFETVDGKHLSASRVIPLADAEVVRKLIADLAEGLAFLEAVA